MKIELTPFPVLLTERLVLRRLVMADSENLRMLRSDDSVNQYLNRPKNISLEESEAYVKKIDGLLKDNKSLYWVLSIKNTVDLIGTICLWNFADECDRAELGYELMPAYQGQGIMQEAVEKVIEYSFNIVGLKVIIGLIHPEHKASIAVLKKQGFKIDIDNLYVKREGLEGHVVYFLGL